MLPLAEHAPANAELRRVLGEIAAGREWPHRSAEEIKIAASLAPEDKAVQVALAESDIRRRDWSDARSRASPRPGGDLSRRPSRSPAPADRLAHERLRVSNRVPRHQGVRWRQHHKRDQQFAGLRDRLDGAPLHAAGGGILALHRCVGTSHGAGHGRLGLALSLALTTNRRPGSHRRGLGWDNEKVTSLGSAQVSRWRGCRPTTGASTSARNTSRATRQCARC